MGQQTIQCFSIPGILCFYGFQLNFWQMTITGFHLQPHCYPHSTMKFKKNLSAHDAFLEYPSSGTIIIKKWQSKIIEK
jgi:hypothetical protein